MVLDLHSEREQLAKRILMIEDARVLHEIQLFVERELHALEEGISIEQYNAEIDQGLLEIENGLGTDQDTLMEEIKRW